MKWLVEIAREYFQNILKEKTKDLVNSVAKAKKSPLLTSTQKVVVQSINFPRPQSITRSRGQAAPQAQAQGQGQARIITDQSKKKFPSEIPAEDADNDKNFAHSNNLNSVEFAKSGSPKNLDYKVLAVPLAKPLKNNSREHPKYLRSQTNPKEAISALDPLPVDQTQFQINISGQKDGKNSRRGPEFYKQNGSLVQMYAPIPNHNSNPLDVIEDLDGWQLNLMIPQPFNLYKNIKKNKESHLVTIDLDKKKELVNHVYKNLYNRNLDIERGITNYQFKLVQNQRLDYEPNNKPRKGENFCDNYAINFTKRFPHVVRPIPLLCVPTGNVSINNSKAKTSKDSKDCSPIILSLLNQGQDAGLNDPSPFSMSSPKNGRSSSLKLNQKDDSPILYKEEDYGNQQFNDIQAEDQDLNQSQILVNNRDSFMENQPKTNDYEEVYTKKKASTGQSFGYRSEHHFRIVKKRANLFQEIKPTDERSLASTGAKTHKTDQVTQSGNSEETMNRNDGDQTSERYSIPQSIATRREISSISSKNQAIEASTFQKVIKTTMTSQEKMRSWSTEKSRPLNMLDDIAAKSLAYGKPPFRQFTDCSPLESKYEKLNIINEKVQIRSSNKSHITSPKNDEEELVNIGYIGYSKMVKDTRSVRPDLDNNRNEIEEELMRQSVSSKSPTAIPRLYPKHSKHYSEPSQRSEGQNAKEN